MKARGYAPQECNQGKVLQQEGEIHISVNELLRSRELSGKREPECCSLLKLAFNSHLTAVR